MSEDGPSPKPSFLITLLDFKGRITPGQYWASIAIGLVCLVAAFAFAVTAMDPRGSDGGLLFAVPLLGMFIWLLAAAMTKRLRDAGKPAWTALGFMIGLIGWLGLGIELFDVAWPLLPLGLFGLLALVGHIDSIVPNKRPSHDAS